MIRRDPVIVIYSAASLDGYIARSDGSIDWLTGGDGAAEDYRRFIAPVDCLLMGRRTYDQVRGFGEWPYEGKPVIVFTHAPPSGAPDGVEFVSGGIGDILDLASRRGFGRIWLVGGAGLSLPFLRQSLVDEFTLFVMPILLGGGIPLFPAGFPEQALELLSAEPVGGGAVKLAYRRKRETRP